MKYLLIFILALATVKAFDLRRVALFEEQTDVSVIEENETSNRIINGQIAKPGQFPYLVSIATVYTETVSLIGSGVIISPNWILTAAHCLDSYHNAQSVTIGYGSNIRSSPEVSLVIPKSDIILHPNWFNLAMLNDIALIRVPTITYSETIQPVKLPAVADSYGTYAGEYGIISGWGKTSDADIDPSDVLHYALMPIISNEECKQFYGAIIQPTNLCASTYDGISICVGDSGAPIVSETTGELIGLTSFGSSYPSCAMDTPDAFTRVSNYMSWIISTTDVAA